MPRITKPLTSTEIKNSKPKGKEYKLNDGGGLSFRVRINGTKDWIFRYYEPFTKKRKDMSFGNYPTVSLAKPQEINVVKLKSYYLMMWTPKHTNLKVNVLSKKRKTTTLCAVTQEWMKIKSTTVSSKFAVQIMASLNNHVLPTLGEVPIDRLTPTLVIEVLNPACSKR